MTNYFSKISQSQFKLINRAVKTKILELSKIDEKPLKVYRVFL